MLAYGAFYLALGYLCLVGLTWLVTRDEPDMWNVRDKAAKPAVVLLGLIGVKVTPQANRPEVRKQMERDNALEFRSRSRRPSRFESEQAAKEYLISRIVTQAERDGVPLSEIERKMLYFSETGWTLPGILDINAEFERDYDDTAYEERIAGVVRNLVEQSTPEEQQTWHDAVLKLSEGDHYLLVLIDGGAPSSTHGRFWNKLTPWLPAPRTAGSRPRGDFFRLIALAILILALLIAWGILRDRFR